MALGERCWSPALSLLALRALRGKPQGGVMEKFKNKTEGKGEVPKNRKAKFTYANAKCK